jgi:chemosensory pili system protein ChpA (sensor histidine kinase/response regulator)
MTQANESDLGPLTWVKSEIDQALARADEAIHEAETGPAADSPAKIQFAQTHVHQVHGALKIVGLDGLTIVVAALDLFLGTLARGDAPGKNADAKNLKLAHRALASIANYLDELVRGTPDQPLRLAPLYRELTLARGEPAPSAADLFFPDLSVRVPKRGNTPQLAPPERLRQSRTLRSHFQRGLLHWLKHPDDAAGPNAMRSVLTGLEILEENPAMRGLWWVAQGFIDTLSATPPDDYPETRRHLSRLEATLRHTGENHQALPERLLRELLYQIAIRPTTTATQQAVRKTWQLQDLIPDADATVSDLQLAPLLQSLHNRLTAIKDQWNTFGEHGIKDMSDFVAGLDTYAKSAATLGRPVLDQLLGGMTRFAQWLGQNTRRYTEPIALEFATAVLLVESALDRSVPDAGFKTQVSDVFSRLEALTRGEQVSSAPSAAGVDAARRRQEKDALAQLSHEILSNLANIEQALDDFFRDHSKRAPLAHLGTPLNQIQGALTLLGEDDALVVLQEATQTIERLAQEDGPIDDKELGELAHRFSALGFFIQSLQYSRTSLDQYLSPSMESGETHIEVHPEADVEIELPTLPELPATPPAPVAAAPATPKIPDGIESFPSFQIEVQGTPSHIDHEEPVAAPAAPIPPITAETQRLTEAPQEELDAELLCIFIEEAHEVLGTIDEHLELLRAAPGNQEYLTTIRRGFHTLKGSGRMVGLADFGEAAWGMEQTLNRWLQLEWPVTPALLQLLADSYPQFSAWVDQIETRGIYQRDVSALLAEAQHLRDSEVPIEEPGGAATQVTETAGAAGVEAVPVADAIVAPEEEPLVLDEIVLTETPEAETEITIDEVTPDSTAATETEFERTVLLPTAGLGGADEIPEDTGSAGTPEIQLEGLEDIEGLDFELELEPATTTEPPTDIPVAVPVADTGALDETKTSLDVPSLDFVPDEDIHPLVEEHDEGDYVHTQIHTQISPTGFGFGQSESADLVNLEEPIDDLEAVAAQAKLAEADGVAEVPLEAEEHVAPVTEPAAAPVVSAAPSIPDPDVIYIGDIDISRALFDLYIVEAQHHISTLHQDFAHLTANPTLLPPETALRAAHSCAGISGTARFSPLFHLGKALENALQRLHDLAQPPSPNELALFKSSSNVLEAMLAEVIGLRLPLEAPELIEQLDKIGHVPAEHVVPEEAPLNEAIAEAAGEKRGVASPVALASDAAAALPVDEIDEQLLPVFLEEAEELINSLHTSLRIWVGDTSSAEHPKLIKRLLHTMKGSARMAGAMTLGYQVHQLESRLESALNAGEDVRALAEEIASALDLTEQLIGALTGGPAPDLSSLSSPASGVATTAPAATSATTPTATQPATAAAAADAGGEGEAANAVLRIRAEVVDSFVNDASEIGVARTRIDGELRHLRRSLLDLTENVIRLRNQLREVEIQSDVQMQTRIAQAETKHSEFDPLEMDRYTRLQELTRMMAESVNDVTTVQQNLLRNLDSADLAINSQARITRDLQQALMQVRMVRFDSLAVRLYRIVRQGAKELGKRVDLDLRGGQIEIDRSVLEHIIAPLEHLLRNSLAHGIEKPEERRARGKAEIGQITLTARQEGNEIVIELADDGAGLNLERISQRAHERGLLAPNEIADERRLTNLIFVPGFSTAEKVSAVSGRGVGMDVVKAETSAVGGRVDVASSTGNGTTFSIYLPLTLAVTQALLVRTGSRYFAIPSSMVSQVSEMKADAIERLRSAGGTEWMGQSYPYRYLPNLLGDAAAQPELGRYNWVLLLHSGAQTLALHVDALHGNQEIIVKNAGPQLTHIVGMSGATVLGNGEIVLIINPVAMATREFMYGGQISAQFASQQAADVAAAQPAREPTVMVVDDSLTVRKITSRMLEREGYRVVLAKDGVDALEVLIESVPDVILSDIEMPRMDGFDLVRNIRADIRLKDVPIIMITSRLADKHREYAMEIGANHYLGKPYQEDELLGLIAGYVRRH